MQVCIAHMSGPAIFYGILFINSSKEASGCGPGVSASASSSKLSSGLAGTSFPSTTIFSMSYRSSSRGAPCRQAAYPMPNRKYFSLMRTSRHSVKFNVWHLERHNNHYDSSAFIHLEPGGQVYRSGPDDRMVQIKIIYLTWSRMGQTVNSHWTTNAREHSLDFREHPLDPRKPPNTTQKPENMWRTTNDPEGPSPRGTYKRKRKRYVIHSRKDSHWERLLTWASERNRRYPRRPTEARKEEGNSKDRTIESGADTLCRRE